jgi:hypothetical protein
MPEIRGGIVVAGPAAAAQALWADPARWPNIVDDFRAVISADPGWPEEGRVVWQSTPSGRGRVIERVVEWSDGLQVLDIEDEKTKATQTAVFQEKSDGVEFSLTLKYRLKNGNPAMKIVDLLFIRRSLRDSLLRSLRRFAAEREGDLSL